MNNPFDYTPDAECAAAFAGLCARIESLKCSDRPEDVGFCRELESGKMLGVLIAADDCGVHHTLYAFSGQIGGGGFEREGFVGPVFDYLQPDGYFRTHEAAISRQNAEISLFEKTELAAAREACEQAKARLEAEVADYKEHCRLSKLERAALRASRTLSEEEEAAMTRQSQFEKAELHRIKKKVAEALSPLASRLEEAEAQRDALKNKRRADSEALQTWLFANFKVLNARGESKSLSEIFAATPMRIPPSGAGECCAPKLLQAAYLRGLTPLTIAEYWYGKPKGGEVRLHGEHYPACRGKCLPVLTWMLKGLAVEPPLDSVCGISAHAVPEILYENSLFCVVNKPSGMLSVPGKGAAISVQEWLTERYGADRAVKMAHRLDQDTSGLLIATFGDEAYKVMQSLFATRQVEKTYEAVLQGDYMASGLPQTGRIELPLSPDYLDRPRQRVDMAEGKEAVTDYEFTGVQWGRSRVLFHPRTGRTHQLRVHSAAASGLGMPIVGDRLYGRNAGASTERLHLHAAKVSFTFPLDGCRYSFEAPTPF